MSRRTSWAFTLVELLVVLSIIGMLMAILLPALSKSRIMAKIAACKANLRQQGIAYAAYTTDNAGFLLNSWYAEKNVKRIPGAVWERPWMVQMHSYAKVPFSTWTEDGITTTGLGANNRANVWTCPDSRPGWAGYGVNNNWESGGTYTYNHGMYQFKISDMADLGAGAGNAYRYPANFSWAYTRGVIRDSKADLVPSKALVFRDGAITDALTVNGSSTKEIGYPINSPASSESNCNLLLQLAEFPWHLDTPNYLMLDGHAVGWGVDLFRGGSGSQGAAYRADLLERQFGQKGTGVLPP